MDEFVVEYTDGEDVIVLDMYANVLWTGDYRELLETLVELGLVEMS